MGSLEQLETLALIVVGSAILFSLWMWASDSIGEAKQKSIDDKEDAVECSNLNIQIVDKTSNKTHTTVFFTSNIDVRVLEARFAGNSTELRRITGVSKEALVNVSAPVSEAEVGISAPNCSISQ